MSSESELVIEPLNKNHNRAVFNCGIESLDRYLKRQGLTQTQAAQVLHITQPRVNALLKGKINDFRLDSLVDMAHRLQFP